MCRVFYGLSERNWLLLPSFFFFLVFRLYYTKVQLGSPPREFFVQIDTGSAVLWVSCSSCNGCPTASGLKVKTPITSRKVYTNNSADTITSLNMFSLCRSSLSSLTHQVHRQLHKFRVQTRDVQLDLIQLTQPVLMETNAVTHSSTEMVVVHQAIMYLIWCISRRLLGMQWTQILLLLLSLGKLLPTCWNCRQSASYFWCSWWILFFCLEFCDSCSTSQTGDLTKSDRAVDGIFGFGQQSMSVISQLASRGLAPNAFSHCLKGSNSGGGILVLGEIVEPNIVYTPLVPSQYVLFSL